ncbi:hypothetical protein AB0A71_18675 [Kitasatospora aureofaciens]|uniref:hypothetical protein n=1 Tax=Kitasatospora aureofaciens TaxID=1894 RepID=UPI0033D9A32D
MSTAPPDAPVLLNSTVTSAASPVPLVTSYSAQTALTAVIRTPSFARADGEADATPHAPAPLVGRRAPAVPPACDPHPASRATATPTTTTGPAFSN